MTLAKRRGPGDTLEWASYLGMIARGKPESLILIKLPVKKTSKRAPGPGPLRLGTWKPIAERFLKDSHIILHTDAARAYTRPIPGVAHTHRSYTKKEDQRQVGGAFFYEACPHTPSNRPNGTAHRRHSDHRWHVDVIEEGNS